MKITSKGQVTIPPDMRRKHGLLPRREVEFVDQPDGVLVIKAGRHTPGKRVLAALLRGGKVKGDTTGWVVPDPGCGMILVDTSVIADILTKDPNWFEWSSRQIERWADEGLIAYDTIAFAELAVKFDTQKELEHRLSAFTYLPLPINAAFQAGKAFEKYLAGGWKESPTVAGFLHWRARIRRPSAAADTRPASRPHIFPVGAAYYALSRNRPPAAACNPT